MRRLHVLGASILAVLSLAVPAGAGDDHDWVELGYRVEVVPLDAGYVVVVLCNASAVTSVQTDIAMATAVRCSINGREDSRALPGREAYTTVNDTVVGPYTVCLSGQAAFADPVRNSISVVSAGPECFVEQV